MSCIDIAPGVARCNDGKKNTAFRPAMKQVPHVVVEGYLEVSPRVDDSPGAPTVGSAGDCAVLLAQTIDSNHQQHPHPRHRQPWQRSTGRKENTVSTIYRFPCIRKGGNSSGAAVTARKSKPALPFARSRRQQRYAQVATDKRLLSSASSVSSLSSLSTTSVESTIISSLSPIIENILPTFATAATNVSATNFMPPAGYCVPQEAFSVDSSADEMSEGGRVTSVRGGRGGEGGSCGGRSRQKGASSVESGRVPQAHDTATTWDTSRIPTGTAAPAERGLNGVWRCPSTSSLREEANANLAYMAKPNLWKSRGGTAVREAARAEMASILGRYKALRKRDRKGDFSWALKIEMNEDERERWMKRRALMRPNRFTVQQRRELRKWFDSLDRDGSGEIDALELSHPLLSTGIARSSEEVHQLVKQVDKDGSGEIGFQEFLSILQPRTSNASRAAAEAEAARGGVPVPPKALSAVNKIVTLQEVKKAHGSDMETVVAIKRRSLLMKEILDEAALRDWARNDVAEKRYIAERDGDRRALQALKARERRLDVRRARKALFIQAVSDTTDFKKEREKLDMAVRPTASGEDV